MNESIKISLGIHLLIVILLFCMAMPRRPDKMHSLKFELIEKDIVKLKKAPEIVVNAKKQKRSLKTAAREVFGGKRKSILNKKGSVKAKVGNTLTKKEDEKILRKNEDDGLPGPAEEYLITSMPRVLEEIRPQYPKWAKEQKIVGLVVFDIVIDTKGYVRKITLLKGIHPKLDELAKKALMKFKFRPAYIEKKAVVARIKYAIRYTLEN